MEQLVSLIIDLISALFGSRNEKQGGSPPPANRPDPSRPRPQARPSSWEEELRRLLDGQAQASPAPPTQRPPPVPAPQAPRVITIAAPARSVPVASPAPSYPARLNPVLTPPPLPPGIQMANRDLASLSESKQAYARASQLDATAAARIERTPGQHVLSTKVTRRPVSPEALEAVSMFKNARAARQAVLASVIFGPPRALEEQTSINF